jgi:hypothetical protein
MYTDEGTGAEKGGGVKENHGKIRAKRICLSFLAIVWLFTPAFRTFAGTTAADQGAGSGRPVSAQGDYRPHAPAQPTGFLDLLTISPIGETRPVAPGRVTRSVPSGAKDDFGFFPNRSRSYLFSLENYHQDNRYVGFAWLDRFDSGQTSKMYANELRAELMIGYSLTTFSSVLFGMGMQFERPGVSAIRFQDDGWRFKFIKKF